MKKLLKGEELQKRAEKLEIPREDDFRSSKYVLCHGPCTTENGSRGRALQARGVVDICVDLCDCLCRECSSSDSRCLFEVKIIL